MTEPIVDVRNLGEGEPCLTHEEAWCPQCMLFTTYTPEGVFYR